MPVKDCYACDGAGEVEVQNRISGKWHRVGCFCSTTDQLVSPGFEYAPTRSLVTGMVREHLPTGFVWEAV